MTEQFILDHCKRYGHLWGKETTVLASAWVKTKDGWINPHTVTKTQCCKHCGKADVSPFLELDQQTPSKKFLDLLEIKPPAEIYLPTLETQS